MTGRASFRLGIACALCIALLSIALSNRAAAQVQCPGGTVAITDATRPAATAAGLPASVSCWNPNDPNVGLTAGNAKIQLQQIAIHNANISCLNTTFAEQLDKMVQAIPPNLGKVSIDSGYRDPSTQAALVASGASKVGACGTYHNYGLAADFNFSSKQVVQWIRANASTFGLAVIGNPTTGCFSSGFCDPAHVQESGPLPSRNQCGICSNSAGNGTQPAPPGAVTTNPDTYIYTPPAGTQAPAGYCLVSAQPVIYTPCSASSSVMPLASPALANAPQNPLPASYTSAPAAVAPAASSPATVAPSASSATSSSCTPQYSCSNNTVYYESDSCATSVFQTCQYGCSGTICNPAPAQNTSSAQSAVPSASFMSAAPIATSSAFSINTLLSQSLSGSVAGLASTSQLFAQNGVATIATGSGQYLPESGETFASSDLSQSTGPQPALSPLQNILSGLRSVLVSLLGFFTHSSNASA